MSGSTQATLTPNVKTQTGNRVELQFGGVKVGLIQSCRASDDYGLEPASGVGDIHVVEYVPTRATHRLTVSNMVLIAAQMRSAGIALENGDAALKGNTFQVVYYSKDTGAALCTYTGVSWGSGDVDVSAHRIVMQSGQLYALDRNGTGL